MGSGPGPGQPTAARSRRRRGTPERLRPRQVFQPVQTEVAQTKTLRQACLDQGPSRVRNDDLAAVRGRRDPRGVMNIDADVLIADEWRFAGVEANPDADRFIPRPRLGGEFTLRLGGCAARVQGALEHAEKRIAFGAQFPAVAACERRTQNLVMNHLRLHVALAELLHQLSRSLDIGEKERYGAGRKTHWGDVVRAASRTPCKSLDSWR